MCERVQRGKGAVMVQNQHAYHRSTWPRKTLQETVEIAQLCLSSAPLPCRRAGKLGCMTGFFEFPCHATKAL